MKKSFGLLIGAMAVLLATAPSQAQAEEERRALEPKRREQAYEQTVTAEVFGVGEETFSARASMNVRPEGELNAEDITVGGVYYDADARKLSFVAEYKLPEGVNSVSYSLFEGETKYYSAQARNGNGYQTVVWNKNNVTGMPTEEITFTVGFAINGEWVAYKTVQMTPVEWVWGGSMELVDIHENATSAHMSVYLPAEATNAEFAFFCGDKIVGTPRYMTNGSASYLYFDFGLHNAVYYSTANRVRRLSGTMYFAEKLDADKEYTVKARWNDEWVTVGTVDVKDGIYVTGVSRVVVREDKPVVRVNYQGTLSPNFTVELADAEGTVVASAVGTPDVCVSSVGGLWILNTAKTMEELSGTTIRVKDADGVVLRTGSFYNSNRICNFYYDYYKDRMVLLTNGLPDGTVIEVLTENNSGECVGTATVEGDKAIVEFTRDGVPYVPEKDYYYNFQCNYTVDGMDGYSYLYGDIYSLEGENPNDYNDIYDGDMFTEGVTEREFSIRIYKNTWDKYAGEISLEVVDSTGTTTGSVQILNGPELREWWLGQDEDTTPFYEYDVKWTGEELQEGYYSVILYRGSEQVTEFNDGLRVLNSDNAYGYFYMSNAANTMNVTYRSFESLEELDLSLLEFTFTDFAGNVLDLPVTLKSSNKSSANFTADKSGIPGGCLGVLCTAAYDGKPVYNMYNTRELCSAQVNLGGASYSIAGKKNNLYSFSDAAYGLEVSEDATVIVREVGSVNIVAIWDLKQGITNFDKTMLAGLAYNDFSKPYSVEVRSADGYAGYYEKLYLYIDGEEIIGGGTDEPDDPNGGGTVVDPETDPIDAFVTRMYQVILEREPDAGSSTWIDGLKDGSMTGVRVADGFVLSEEMLNKDISNEEFVKILYRAFFGREADEGGLATWKGLLDNGCKKTYVFAGFANSAEFGALCTEAGIVQGRAVEYLADRQTGLSEQDYKVWCFVERMYTEVLKRTADESGVRTWVGVLQDGSYTGVRVADGFLMSEEFLAKDMTNEEYVRIMYRAFFGRDADAEGLATWTNALATGWTKQRVFAGFANSNEFGVLCEQAGIVKGTAAEQ